MTVAWQSPREPKPAWPDLSVDRIAFQRACEELPTATLSTVLQRAQTIKEELNGKQ
jgi:hypothetical protein